MYKKKVFLIVGEKSGENIALSILNEMKKDNMLENLDISGVVGDSLVSMGVVQSSKSSDIAVMGVFEVLLHLPKILRVINKTTKNIVDTKPDLVISIDSYDFCIRVAKKVKKINPNIHFLHIVAPSVWAYKPSRAKVIAKCYNTLLCILPFEPQYFIKHGLDAKFIGNPAIYNIKNDFDTYLQGVEAKKDNNLIAVTLGSRVSEIKRHVALIKGVMDLFAIVTNGERKMMLGDRELKFVFLMNDDIDISVIKFVKNNLLLNEKQIIIEKKEKLLVMKTARVALTKSGTNSLEFLIAKTPVVVYYKVATLTYILARFFLKIKFVHLVNIMANKIIVPEFIQKNANSVNLYHKLVDFLNNDNTVNSQLTESLHYCNLMLADKLQLNPSAVAKGVVKDVLHL
jgi:lipid-A-disaccharide synthase